MAFIGETADPWDVPIKQAVKVMQTIWDATSSVDYEITASTAVYRKVCNQLASRMNDIMVCFRRFNTLQTRGAILLDLLASQ